MRSVFRLSCLVPLLASGLTLSACADDPAAGGDTSPTTTVGSTGDTGDTDTTDTGIPTDMGETGDGGGGCAGILCGTGTDEDCCDPASEECLGGACVDICESAIRCGEMQEVCCMSDEVCISPTCTVPGADCGDSYDCPPDQFCEPTLNKCLPQFDPNSCEVQPDFGDLEITQEWAWTDDMVISLPLVADINGDEINEVVFVAVDPNQVGGWQGTGEIVAVDGETGAELWRLTENAPNSYGANGRGQPALADVDGDGLPDVIYSGRPDENNKNLSIIHAVDGEGNLIWSSDKPVRHRNGAITVANFDMDDMAEIVIGATLMDHDGTLMWDASGTEDGGLYGSNGNYQGAVPIVVDLDDDDKPEIVSGKQAWKVNWQPGPNVIVSPMWDAGDPDGYPAAADIDQDGDPEIVLVGQGTVRILNGATGALWCGVDATDVQCVNNANLRTPPVDIPGGGRGGPPTIADFDGDGRPEIGVAGGSAYAVIDVNRNGEVIVQPMGDPVPAAGHAFVRWWATTQDQTSNVTGSSVFDFQGDGPAEVVYADECYLRVYDGATGSLYLEEQNSTSTIHEYPLVTDVDRDGNAEILIVANDYNADLCVDMGYTPRNGVYAYGDANDRWVPTRRLWTQHAYHVTDATSAGNVPTTEAANWTVAGLNNYRQNVQGTGVFNASDLTVDLSAKLAGCPDEVVLEATVRNIGTLGVPKGVMVSFYRGADASGELVSSMATIDDLLPGAQTAVTLVIPMADLPPQGQQEPYYVGVDMADLGEIGDIVECDETNNESSVNVGCPNPG